MNRDGKILVWIFLFITIIFLKKGANFTELNISDKLFVCFGILVSTLFWIGIANKDLRLIVLTHKLFSLFLILGPLVVHTEFTAMIYIGLSIIMFISWNYNKKGCIWSNTTLNKEDKPKHLFRDGIFGRYYLVEIYCLLMCVIIITRIGFLKK